MKGFVLFFLRIVFSLRYRVSETNIDLAPFKKNKGVFILANHSSRIDPLLIFLFLFQKGIVVRPIAVDYLFRWPWLRPLLKRVKAISVPNFENGSNEFKLIKTNQALSEVCEGLKRGENFLFFPSGLIKKTARESIGGASGAFNILNQVPDCEVALLRIAGLWGSGFSRAISGEKPDFLHIAQKGMKAVLSNGVFFTPRRHISIEIEAAPNHLLKTPSRMEFNRKLEDWFNDFPSAKAGAKKEELLQIVPLSRWKKNQVVPKTLPQQPSSQSVKEISPETRNRVYAEIRRILNQPALELEPRMHLSRDLGFDSLNLAELSIFLFRSFHIKQKSIQDVQTIQDLLEIAEGLFPSPKKPAGRFFWPEENRRPSLEPLLAAKTLPEALFHICKKLKGEIICADDILGPISYRKFQQAVKVLAAYFLSFPENRIAVLLPASSMTYIVIFALQLAQKTPVMLNWTLGSYYLEQMMEISGAQRVISSWNFIDQLPHVEFGSVVHKLQFLEDIREKISLKTKLKALFRKWNLDACGEDLAAVILFTSGTEKAPKAVPLTHQNILSNFRSVFQWIPFKPDHIPLNALPPFHSLGFSVTGVFPLISGFRSVFFPDPTDHHALTEGIARWKVTHVSLPPTFLQSVLSVAKKEDLCSVQVFFCGGERTPPELKNRIEKEYPEASFIEGYGVTECSPCISLGHPKLAWKGVGRLLPGIEAITVNPEDRSPLAPGHSGEICIHGLNVFSSYIGNKENPFIEFEGKKWYCTGDLGYIDNHRNLILEGRLKRFVKLGGEMISLFALESTLTERFLANNPRLSPPFFAIDYKEKEITRLILYTKISLTKQIANQILMHSGFSPLLKIDETRIVPEIPLTITGKVDYRQLTNLLSS